ncbi:MAG: hypothetical protein OEY94_10495 [Alphaproteobacteria bacterium]|nr:hypothetical protein [Alphaproteobacteria bacterium]
MSWKDYGVIFKVDDLAPWAKSHFYVPTAISLGDVIRVYGAFWDENNYGRLGYVDLDANDPSKVIEFSRKPILDDAPQGLFDCDGVTPLSIVKEDDELRIYYAGWQKFNQTDKRYTIFTGLVISYDNGLTFQRFSNDPVIGPRTDKETVRTGGFTQIFQGNNASEHVWRTWIATHVKDVDLNGKVTPAYNLETMISKDGKEWPDKQEVVFPIKENEILGYGRSAIWKDDVVGKFKGLFSVRSWDARYYGIYYSESYDGLEWDELSLDNRMSFSVSDTCDNQSEVCFPSLIHQDNRIFMFYNGNDFGKEGLRLAIWEDS